MLMETASAKSSSWNFIKGNIVRIVKVKDKQEFIKQFNASKPSKEFLESCRKASKPFGINAKKKNN